MFEVKHRRFILKCPNCNCNINLQEGKVAGGLNDSGGWILKCKGCQHTFPYSVKNPNDFSGVIMGASILDTWDNEIEGDKEQTLRSFSLNLEDYNSYNQLLIQETEQEEPFMYQHDLECLYYCPICNANLEKVAYLQINENFSLINQGLSAFYNYYLKSKAGDPDSIFVSKDIKCNCGYCATATFFKEFNEHEIPIKKLEELFIVDISGVNLENDIDGIYSRDSCIEVLSKLFIRWKAIYNKVFIAVPFIGFDFKNSEEQRVKLWDWLLKYTTPNNTILITRKSTFKSYKEAASKHGLDIDLLKDYGILNPTIEGLSHKKSYFKQQFHAKFYAGFDGKKAELLVGSFNIHEGGYFENIHFKKYDFTEFFKRYIYKLGIFFNPQNVDIPGEVLVLSIKKNELIHNMTEKFTNSRSEVIENIHNYYDIK